MTAPVPPPAAAGTAGEAAYNASVAVMRDDFEGEPWAWDKLPAKHRQSWDAAAAAVIARLAASHDLTPETMPAKLQLAYDRLYEAGKREPGGAAPAGALAAEVPSLESLAHALHDAYWLVLAGDEYTWEGEEPEIREGWLAVARAVRERLAPGWAELTRLYQECEAELQEVHAVLVTAYGHDNLSEETPTVVAALAAERDRQAGELERMRAERDGRRVGQRAAVRRQSRARGAPEGGA